MSCCHTNHNLHIRSYLEISLWYSQSAKCTASSVECVGWKLQRSAGNLVNNAQHEQEVSGGVECTVSVCQVCREKQGLQSGECGVENGAQSVRSGVSSV